MIILAFLLLAPTSLSDEALASFRFQRYIHGAVRCFCKTKPAIAIQNAMGLARRTILLLIR